MASIGLMPPGRCARYSKVLLPALVPHLLPVFHLHRQLARQCPRRVRRNQDEPVGRRGRAHTSQSVGWTCTGSNYLTIMRGYKRKVLRTTTRSTTSIRPRRSNSTAILSREYRTWKRSRGSRRNLRRYRRRRIFNSCKVFTKSFPTSPLPLVLVVKAHLVMARRGLCRIRRVPTNRVILPHTRLVLTLTADRDSSSTCNRWMAINNMLVANKLLIQGNSSFNHRNAG